MTVQIKSGGAWRTATNGGIRMRNGGAWKVANGLYIKSGGVWRDSSYRGYPNPPGTPTVYDWSFTTVRVQWPAPAAGGAPTVSTDVVMTNSALNPDSPMQSQNIPANSGVSNPFNVAEDYQVAFFVRSVSAGGLKSAWAAVSPVRVLIGHSQLSHTVTDTLTRPWSNSIQFNGMHRDEQAPIYVPSSVQIYNWHVYCYLNFPGPYVSGDPSAGNNRQVNSMYVSQDVGPNFGYPWNQSSFETDVSISANGQNAYWGFYTRGIGWSPPGINSQLLYGSLRIDGTETYTQDRTVIDRNYQANQYW